jgi:hypothetical protein
MLDAIIGLLQQSPPQVETKFPKSLRKNLRYENLLAKPKRLSEASNKGLLNKNESNIIDDFVQKEYGFPEIVTMVAKDQNIPSDFLIKDVLDPIAWHESDRTMNPLMLQKKGGPGKGMFQFEGRRGVRKTNKKTGKKGFDSFDVAINRAKNYFDYKNLPVPSWITDIKKKSDATSLSADQQKALALLNFTRIDPKNQRVDRDLKKLYENKISITNFWAKNHHRKPTEKQKKTFNENLNLIHKIRTDAASL